ncbi:hypothetical protein Peur_053262 [Populus x canadensis]
MEPPIQKNDDDVTTAIITAAAAPGLGKMKKNTKRKRLAGKAVIIKGFREGDVPATFLKVIIEQRAEYRPGGAIPEIYDASVIWIQREVTWQGSGQVSDLSLYLSSWIGFKIWMLDCPWRQAAAQEITSCKPTVTRHHLLWFPLTKTTLTGSCNLDTVVEAKAGAKANAWFLHGKYFYGVFCGGW